MKIDAASLLGPGHVNTGEKQVKLDEMTDSGVVQSGGADW